MTKSVENKGVKEKSGLKFTKVLITVIILSLTAIVLAQEWQQIPLRTAKQKAAGLKGGEGCQQIMDIAYAPSNPKVVYLISDTSQTWKSSDGGFNWKMCHNGLHANGGFSIVVDPNNENIVFVASCIGRGLSPGTEKSLSGICRSVNGAESWQMVKKVRFLKNQKDKSIKVNFCI